MTADVLLQKKWRDTLHSNSMIWNTFKKRGFTLIEVFVVMGIIAILATIIVVATRDARTKALDVARIKAMNDLSGALTLYYIDHKKYPSIAPVCEHVSEDYDEGTSVNDDAPVCYASSSGTPACNSGANYPTCDGDGYRQKFEDSYGDGTYGCSGDGTPDVKTCGWGVNRGAGTYSIYKVSGGVCSTSNTKLNRMGQDNQTYPADPNYTSGNYPTPTQFSDPDFQESYVGDFMDTNSNLLQTLFNEGYLSRDTWGMPEVAGDKNINTCRYFVRGEDNLDDGDGVYPWEGNVQNYLLFCNLETLTDKEENDGGFNPNVYEIYSPGDPKICVTGSQV